MLDNGITITLIPEQWRLILQGLDRSERIVKHGIMDKLERYVDLEVEDLKKVEVDTDIKVDINTVKQIQESREAIEKATSNFRVKQEKNGKWETIMSFDPMKKEKDETQVSINAVEDEVLTNWNPFKEGPPDDMDGVPADIWYRLAGLTWGQTIEVENDEGVPITVLISKYITETSSYSCAIQNGLMRFRKHYNDPWLRIVKGEVVEED